MFMFTLFPVVLCMLSSSKLKVSQIKCLTFYQKGSNRRTQCYKNSQDFKTVATLTCKLKTSSRRKEKCSIKRLLWVKPIPSPADNNEQASTSKRKWQEEGCDLYIRSLPTFRLLPKKDCLKVPWKFLTYFLQDMPKKVLDISKENISKYDPSN